MDDLTVAYVNRHVVDGASAGIEQKVSRLHVGNSDLLVCQIKVLPMIMHKI